MLRVNTRIDNQPDATPDVALETASAGHVFMANREVAGPSLERGVVFQGHALMPWLTVRGNIAFAVKSKWPDMSAAEVDGLKADGILGK